MTTLDRPQGKVLTYEDYLRLEDEKRYEVIDGGLMELTTPTPLHQGILGNIVFLVWDFVRKREVGKILHAPLDVVFSARNVLQPDMIFISKDRLGIIGEKAIMGPPDLVVEIISPATVRRDTVVKRGIYERLRVRR